MENTIKYLRRIIVAFNIALVLMICLALVVLAVPSSVSNLIGTASDTSIYITWTLATGSNSTVIRYSTSYYPSSPTGGTSGYNGTASYATISNLTAGTTYYISAWGYDGSDYSTNSTTLVVSTLPAVSENETPPFAKPTLPSEVSQDPGTSGWSIYPIDEILEFFADPTNTHSGLGMPVDNMIMFFAGFGVTLVSISTYVKWRSFFTSWAVALIICAGLCSIQVMQWIVVGYLLLIGAGVWAVENSTQ